MLIAIERDWMGAQLPDRDRALVTLSRQTDLLIVELDAPYFGDAPPPSAAGPTPRLWEHEVVELFLADRGDHYFELELGPHGHYLALELRGVRQIVRGGVEMELAYEVRIEPRAGASPSPAAGPIGRYRGIARVPMSYLPNPPSRVNAYLIHGSPDARCYHAHTAVPGSEPDFHRLEHFAPLEW